MCTPIHVCSLRLNTEPMYFKLRIPEPCHEDWSQMTLSEQGRFCSSCEKEVIDFTQLTRKQIADKVQSGGQLCGRYRKDQLDTTYFIPEEKSPFKHLGIAAAFTSLLALCEPVLGQENNSKSNTELITQENQITTVDTINNYIFSGIILAEDSLPLPGANIHLKDSSIGAIADFDGHFSISIPSEYFKESRKLLITFLGYEDKEVLLSANMPKMNIILKEDPSMMELGVVVVGQTIEVRKTKKPRSKRQ